MSMKGRDRRTVSKNTGKKGGQNLRLRIKAKPRLVRDAKHPLRVLALCFGGIRSSRVEKGINTALREMGFEKFFYVRTAASGPQQVKESFLKGFDIVLVPSTPGVLNQYMLFQRIKDSLGQNSHKLVLYTTHLSEEPIETGEELVNRILTRAGKFLDLRF